MALAELLWKQGGDVSLDKARQAHAHHGVQLKSRASNNNVLENFCVEPHFVKDKATGTFEIWRQSASHSPLHGECTDHYVNDVNQSYCGILLGHTEESSKLVMPIHGITLLHALEMLPAMVDKLRELGLSSKLVHCQMTRHRIMNESGTFAKSSETTFILNRCDKNLSDEIMGKFKFLASDYARVNLRVPIKHYGGFIVDIEGGEFGQMPMGLFPDGYPFSREAIFTWGGDNYLNEFGYIYVASYATGMMTRYYPDIWMMEMNKSSSAFLAIESFLDTIVWRAPMLLLGEFSGSVMLLGR